MAEDLGLGVELRPDRRWPCRRRLRRIPAQQGQEPDEDHGRPLHHRYRSQIDVWHFLVDNRPELWSETADPRPAGGTGAAPGRSAGRGARGGRRPPAPAGRPGDRVGGRDLHDPEPGPLRLAGRAPRPRYRPGGGGAGAVLGAPRPAEHRRRPAGSTPRRSRGGPGDGDDGEAGAVAGALTAGPAGGGRRRAGGGRDRRGHGHRRRAGGRRRPRRFDLRRPADRRRDSGPGRHRSHRRAGPRRRRRVGGRRAAACGGAR